MTARKFLMGAEQKKEGFITSLIARRELISSLVGRNLKIRYKGSALGFLWSLLTPLSSILIYAVFAKLLKFGGDGFLPYLISGVIIWQLTVSCLTDSLYAIIGNANLVKKVLFPRLILPLSTAFANTINFLFTFIVLFIYLLVAKNLDYSALYLLPLAILMQLMLCIGITAICSTMNVFFRDTEHIISVIAQAWFFMTPIMYPIDYQVSIVAAHGLPLWTVYLNPMTGILALYREALLINPTLAIQTAGVTSAQICSLEHIGVSFIVSFLLMLCGPKVLKIGDKHFGDVL